MRTVSIHSLGVLFIAACSQGTESPPNSSTLSVRAAVTLENSDVDTVRYLVTPVDCASGDALDTPEVFERPVEPGALPGNIAELGDAPLDSNSAHAFADLLEVVPSGCYDIAAQPVDAGGNPSSDCIEAAKAGVEVVAGDTIEVVLISQCASADPGALDAIAVFNRQPVITDVTFGESKFVCGAEGTVCATATDLDLDPLELELELAGGSDCQVNDVSSTVEGDTSEQCWTLLCDSPGRVDFTITVYDQLWDGGSLVRIEDWMAMQEVPAESNGSLDVFAYVDGITAFPDADGDGYGDATNVGELVCEVPSDFVANADDCDDSDPSVSPAGTEICNGLDDDCNGTVDGADIDTSGATLVDDFDSWDTNLWEGNQWCYNNDEGAWSPNVEDGQAEFKNDDYCRLVIRTVQAWSSPVAVCAIMTPELASGGVNLDSAIFAFSSSWINYSSGVPYVGASLESGAVIARQWAPTGQTATAFDAYLPGAQYELTLVWPDASGDYRVYGPGSSVEWSSPTLQDTGLRFGIAVENSIDGLKLDRVVVQEL